MAEKRKKLTAPLARVKVAAARKGGLLVGSALARLLKRFGSAESADNFAKWRMMPETQLFVDALRECALNPAAVNQESDSYEVQYGITSGIQMSAMLIDDPSLIFQGLFGATPGTDDALESTYGTAPDGE